MRPRSNYILLAAMSLLFIGAVKIDWRDMVENDWIYSIATRFSLVGGNTVHYPTPTAELARLLEDRSESAALRHLADARLELGDRVGAWAAMAGWAEREGAAAWEEAARWAMARNSVPEAFAAAEKAMPELNRESKRALCDERILWADQHPEAADPLALMKARAGLFPDDASALEAWLRRLMGANRFDEAENALVSTNVLSAERKLLLRSDLYANRKKYEQAFKILDDAVAEPRSMDFRRAYAVRVDQANPGLPETWRTQLEGAFDAPALIRLCTWFQGQNRGSAAADLVRQMERRHEISLNRDQRLLLSRLYAEVEAIPEAFRAALSAAHPGDSDSASQQDDLALLARLALQTGGRPLSIGVSNDEAYRWAARLDRTPGFWTGAISLLLTGLPFEQSLNQLETGSLRDRAFATALALGDELARRSPRHPSLPALRTTFMARHIESGDGESALALLPLLENTPSADEARKLALAAARGSNVPIKEELRLMKSRLKSLAPDGSAPTLDENDDDYYDYDYDPPGRSGYGVPGWARIPKKEMERYSQTLSQYISRLDYLDKSHQTSVSLILGEMDRMPDAEALWLDLLSRLESWRLDDDLGPRYLAALQRFKGEAIWPRLARWYAKRNYQKELKDLAESLTQRFRSTDIFNRIQAGDPRLAIPEQPPIRDGVRMVPWADWVRFKALERFPHNPRIVREAQRLVAQSVWQRDHLNRESGQGGQNGPVVIPDALVQTKRWAVFFVDADVRESWFRDAMRTGNLVQELEAIESRPSKTPVDDMILSEGWARLSNFEKAAPAYERLAAAYPGNSDLAGQTLSLYRSLNGLGHNYTQAAHALVARIAPSLENPYGLWTELGEMEVERGMPGAAIKAWQALLDREPRNPDRVADLATLLWDYNHDREALSVVAEGRARMGRPGFYAFEAGVLRENLRDIEGAIDEYLTALRGDSNQSDYHHSADHRALRRIAQLLSRQRVYDIVEKSIQSLKPGKPEDEKRLLSFFPILNERASGFNIDDDWIGFANNPGNPEHQGASLSAIESRMAGEDAIRRTGNLILAKTESMAPRATSIDFLEACRTWMNSVARDRWKLDRLVSFESACMARRAGLVPNEEGSIRVEMEHADFLASRGRNSEAQVLWSQLENRIALLPDGVTKMRTEAARASFLEKSGDVSAATAEWKRLGERYPWSFGLLEDRLAFLRRTDKPDESRALLEEASGRAAEGYRLTLLQQLARQSVIENDSPRAILATQRILRENGLSPHDRLEAAEILVRVSIKTDESWDPAPFISEQAAMFNQEQSADLYCRAAQAADAEGVHKTALRMWIEALNRRTDRQWIQSACRSAIAGGVEAELLSFFERQHQRSPRDVRWAVAVRDIRRNLHIIEGTIQAAKAAVAIRPDREDLWREAAEIMVLADNVKEAADYLDGWHRLRPSDEDVAAWRSRLYAQAGEGELAFAVENATLGALQTEPKHSGDYPNRRARAAVRLMENGLIAQSLRIYSQQGDILAVTKSDIPAYQQVRLAIYSGQLIKLLQPSLSDERLLNGIADELRSNGKPEDLEAVVARLSPQLSSASASTRAAALRQWHGFIQRAGIRGALRLAAAREYISGKPGPWAQNPSTPFLIEVGDVLIPGYYNPNTYSYSDPNLDWLWALDLARRDKSEELLTFLEPSWNSAMNAVFSDSRVNPNDSRLKWMSDATVLETWARAASQKPEILKQLNDVFGDKNLWYRFRALARDWNQDVLIALVEPGTRTAMFRFLKTESKASGQVTQARAARTEQVAEAVRRLIQGQPGAADDPVVVKLRGPQTVGELLGNNASWLWTEFTPRRNPNGDITEPDEYRSVGTGIDSGRFPAAIWGQNPGEAWYVLEALARYRKTDSRAAFLPLEYTQSGGESDRAILAINLARSLGDIGLARELDAQRTGSATDPRRVLTRVQLLKASSEHKSANETWKIYLMSRQKNINSSELFSLAQFADHNGLPEPLGLLDASQPLHPELLASLVNKNLNAFKLYKTSDASAFRSALSGYWRQSESGLSASQLRFWLRELWATGSADLPDGGLDKLGGLWRHALPWLSQQAIPQRPEALNALESGGDALIKLLRQSDQSDIVQILTAGTWLAAGNSSRALSLVDKWISENRNDDLGQGSYMPKTRDSEEDNEFKNEFRSYRQYNRARSNVERIRLWMDAFRASGARPDAAERFSGMLKEHYENRAVSQDVWALAFDLSKPEDRPALHKALDLAWFRGQVDSNDLGRMIETLVKYIPREAPKWLKRWPLEYSFQHTSQRADILAALRQPGEAAQVYNNARWRASWRMADDLNAFTAWRDLNASAADPIGPEMWKTALGYWKDSSPISLTERLKSHPLDCFSAASALQTAKGTSEEETLRVEEALKLFDSNPDASILLHVKAARHWLPISWRTAARYVGVYSAETCCRAMSSKKLSQEDINSALEDLARVYHKNGDANRVQAALRILSDKNSLGLKALRAELDGGTIENIADYLIEDGRPAPILPKDLTWALLGKFLRLEQFEQSEQFGE